MTDTDSYRSLLSMMEDHVILMQGYSELLGALTDGASMLNPSALHPVFIGHKAATEALRETYDALHDSIRRSADATTVT